MVNPKADWVDASQSQLVLEGRSGQKSKKISQDNGLEVNAPLDPIPDNDWQGETWGLFWPDQEMEERSEDPTKYIKVVPVLSGSNLLIISFNRNITRTGKPIPDLQLI